VLGGASAAGSPSLQAAINAIAAPAPSTTDDPKRKRDMITFDDATTFAIQSVARFFRNRRRSALRD
jgi:hypothetical protein